MRLSRLNLDEWWWNCDFTTLEKITGYRQNDFSSEDGYEDFVVVCNDFWNNLSYTEKVAIYKEFK